MQKDYVTSYQPYKEGVRIWKSLLRWRRESLESLARCGSPIVEYRSRIIPPDIASTVRESLEACKSHADVKAAFQAIRRRFRLGVFVPRGWDEPLPPVPDVVEITEADIDKATALWDELMPDYRGMLDADPEDRTESMEGS